MSKSIHSYRCGGIVYWTIPMVLEGRMRGVKVRVSFSAIDASHPDFVARHLGVLASSSYLANQQAS